MCDSKVPMSPQTEADLQRQVSRMTRRSFTVGAAAALAGLGGWTWLRTRDTDGGIPWPLRRGLQFNERLASAFFKDSRLAPTFPRDRAMEPRVNGRIGLNPGFDPGKWRLRVDAGARTLEITLDQVKALPRAEIVTELKCVEGWSEVVQWAGATLSNFAAKYRLGTRSGAALDLQGKPNDVLDYVSLDTPDGGYYVGLDKKSAYHPQTLLCYEMNGEPLTLAHGSPLRLFTPTKYGYKSIKRIGTIRFTDQRPADYWAERGYDWYAGH